ncbi:hypothetical protein NOVO_00300 [Rickettsiales bacterium Ac37b]|nr:hypothetical protein NOVO_00300 [Rickettsiales bacterium Ac37b]
MIIWGTLRLKKFLIIIALLFSYLIAKELFDNRPFKFEKYKTYEELNTALKKEFPLDSDMREVIKVLEESGAKCEDRSQEKIMKEELKKYGLIYYCKYGSRMLTLHLLESYTIWVKGNKDYQLLRISGFRTKGIVI